MERGEGGREGWHIPNRFDQKILVHQKQNKFVSIFELDSINFFLSAFLQNCFLCWDRWNRDVMPTLDTTLLSSGAVTLGRVLIWVVSPDWFEELKPLQRHLSYAITILELLQYSSTLGVPDSVYAWFNIVSNTCHPAPCYFNSNKVFLLLSDQFCNPERGFEPRYSSE